jgi:hypothetical protein
VRFIIRAAADAQTLPRLMDHFALRGLIPSKVSAVAIGVRLEVLIDCLIPNEETGLLIRNKMESSILVDRVVIDRICDDNFNVPPLEETPRLQSGRGFSRRLG